MSIYVNRTLNFKKIKVIGFDMDHTIIKYHTENFEKLAYSCVIEKLIANRGYPEKVRELKFDFNRAIQGLVIDKRQGNILKLSRFGKVKQSYHGTKPIDFKTQQEIYAGKAIDLSDPHIRSLDTSFSLTYGIIFAQLVDLKEAGEKLPDYEQITEDVRMALDQAHADGSIKNEVKNNISKYIQQDPEIVKTLERLKKYQKRLIVITNSDFHYSKLLLDHAIAPFLKEHKSWQELFEIVITLAQKPKYFLQKVDYLKVDPCNGTMTNFYGKIVPGIYQGGCADKLQRDLALEGDEILYIGDHIYGDVVSLKKQLNWRTALILEPLKDEVESIKSSLEVQERLDINMNKKGELEDRLNFLQSKKIEEGDNSHKAEIDEIFQKIEKLDELMGHDIVLYQSHFNPYWGELMRAGNEESLMAGQVEKYACIYMAQINDLLNYSPRTYFRPKKRILAHEHF